MMNEYDSKSLQFISLGDIYVHLQNELPQKTSRAILDGFRLAFERLDNKPPLYHLSEGILRKVDVAARVIPSQPSSFEEVGQYIPITLSRVIAAIKNNPLAHQSTKEYGFIRDELNLALGTDFPDSYRELRDYEAEIAKLTTENHDLKNQIEELQELLRNAEPSPYVERHATKREDMFSALLSIMFHPEFYVDIEDMQRKIKSGVSGLDLIRNALPSQIRLAEMLDEKSLLFWPKTGRPPLAVRTVESYISTAINRIKKAK